MLDSDIFLVIFNVHNASDFATFTSSDDSVRLYGGRLLRALLRIDIEYIITLQRIDSPVSTDISRIS
jgi:hypothetical protein